MILSELGVAPGKLPGIGPSRRADLARLGVSTVADLLLLAPRTYEDRSVMRSFAEAVRTTTTNHTPDHGGRANTICRVVAHDYIRTGRGMVLKVLVRDHHETVGALLCFGRNFLARKLPVGSEILLTAIFKFQYNEYQSSEFEFAPRSNADTAENNDHTFFRIEAVYPLSGGLSQAVLRTAVRSAIEGYADGLVDEIPEELRLRRGLATRSEALRMLHMPNTLDEAAGARRRLAYDELLLFQIAVTREVSARPERPALAPALDNGRAAQLLSRLPFEATADQKKVLAEIRSDAGASRAMLRLVQGEVGSGKTLVAFLAALDYIDAGKQVAFLAPTELLARQHAENATSQLDELGVNTALLTGSLSKTDRHRVHEAVAAGDIDLVIGTHALLSDDLSFARLGLVVIDEQHRFGVTQRAALMQKATAPDLLLMSATPIPRTLALTLYGELDISSIVEKPAGRVPVKTHLASSARADEVYTRVRTLIDDGAQAYFVYPLIEAEETGGRLRNVVEMHRYLSDGPFRGVSVGLIHSRMPEADKIEVMRAFAAGETRVLVATSVVEVGVDVPEACCIVIEHAERFGLSALHQLRGRVGRGTRASYAFLVYDEPLTEEGKARLRTLYEESDGFTVAERDLSIRGPGDLAGIRQSGFLGFRFARFPEHEQLLREAREDAREILATDPDLKTASHRRLLQALQIFVDTIGEAP